MPVNTRPETECECECRCRCVGVWGDRQPMNWHFLLGSDPPALLGSPL